MQAALEMISYEIKQDVEVSAESATVKREIRQVFRNLQDTIINYDDDDEPETLKRMRKEYGLQMKQLTQTLDDLYRPYIEVVDRPSLDWIKQQTGFSSNLRNTVLAVKSLNNNVVYLVSEAELA